MTSSLLLIAFILCVVILVLVLRRPGSETMNDDRDLKRKLEEIEAKINQLIAEDDLILELEHKILSRLNQQTGFRVDQIKGNHIMPITGIVVGQSGVFQETPTPPGAVIPAGSIPVWTTSDTTNTALTPSADGTQVAVAVSASAPVGGSFVLTVTNQDGTFPTPSTVLFLASAPPAQTGFQVDQIS